ncbi:unnamed protein product [Prorocentrum cordatum]|uniref:Uncharacterized protein n=1 Tax=Prorocentrum cordatum TaxID=2364126 RepID=A0ABN9XMF2_9DINO|nr:unnamed protein product [Polarella glacialis]
MFVSSDRRGYHEHVLVDVDIGVHVPLPDTSFFCTTSLPLGHFRFCIIIDSSRIPTIVVASAARSADWIIFCRGALADQYLQIAARCSGASRHFWLLRELLAEAQPLVSVVVPNGCAANCHRAAVEGRYVCQVSFCGVYVLASCGALLWIQMLFLASPFTTIGTRCPPIVSAWGNMAFFVLVSAFLFVASTQASYALTKMPLVTILIDTCLMGFIGEMKPHLFISTELDLDANPNAISELDSTEVSQIGFGYLVLLVSSFMVSMANIVIQVMGDAYNRNKDMVHIIRLTRARAEESLITMLWLAGVASLLPRWCCHLGPQDRREFVWFTRGEQREPRELTPQELAAKIDHIDRLMTEI